MTLSEELTWRGFTNQTTYKDITVLNGDPITFYWGVDPSADSMHIGQLAMAMMIGHFMDHGHKAILLVGGATGLIGDPDGKKEERDLKSLDEVEHNKKSIAEQYKQLFHGKHFESVDNFDWFKEIGYLEFLRDVGKHVPMRQMLGREFVQSRLGEEGTGISYAEFSYSLIQGYDFLHLYKEKGATLQVCGADQWGNSIAGVELIRRITGNEAHIWSAPLIINKVTGVKFGKSEGGAVWLDKHKTSIFQFYQFWLNVDDESVGDFLKLYTHVTPVEFEKIMQQQQAEPGQRAAQKYLAQTVTEQVHGKDNAEDVVEASKLVVGKQILTEDNYKLLKNIMGLQEVNGGSLLVEILVQLGLASSNTQARQFIHDGAISINNIRVEDEAKINLADTDIHQGVVVFRRGKNNVAVAQIT